MSNTYGVVAPEVRRRETILAALEIYRTGCGPRNLTSLMQFLYVSENESLNVSELAHISHTSVSVTARTVRVLAGEIRGTRWPVDESIFALRGAGDDKRLRLVHLSDHGRAMRERFDGLINEAIPIMPRDQARF